jgi:hypothetical protein
MSSNKITELNDLFRKTGIGGRFMITSGVNAMGAEFVARVSKAVREFDAFTPDSDPYRQHDFGSIELDGHKVFWKIDCYDKECRYGSEDPSDPSKTTRILTIMFAEEY